MGCIFINLIIFRDFLTTLRAASQLQLTEWNAYQVSLVYGETI